MATVPGTEGLGNVQLRGSRQRVTVQPNADAFGAATGEALQRAGAVTANIAVDMQRRYNESLAKQLDLAYQERSNDILHGENGFYTKRGQDALNAIKPTREALRKAREEVLSQATNDNVRRMVGAALTQRDINERAPMSRYALKAEEDFFNETSAARTGMSINDAVNSRLDQEQINNAKNVGLAEIDARAQRNRWSKEKREAERLMYTSKMHKAIAEAFMDERQPLQAKEHLKKFAKEIDGMTLADLNGRLEGEITKDEARRQADAITAQTNLTPAEQMTMAREIEDTEVRDETVARVKAFHDNNRWAEQEYNRARSEDAWGRLMSTPTFDSIPATLDPETRLKMRNYVQAVMSGEQIPNDSKVYYDLTTLSANDPQGFSKVNLYDYRMNLDNSHFDRVVELQRQVRNAVQGGTTLTDDTLLNVQTINQAAKTAFSELGIDGKSSSDEERRARFWERLQSEVDAFTAQNGRKPSKVEVNEMTRFLTSPVERPTWWGLGTAETPVFEIEVEGVPSGEIDELVRTLQANGYENPTEDQIRKLYDALLLQQGTP